jgi:hypothetical protein
MIAINEKILGWGKRVSFTILDQGCFSGSNFLVSLLLARYVNASEYGVFSITYSIFLFISGIYSSLVLEPINVLGPKNHDKDLLLYKKQSIQLHLLITGGLTILGLLFTLIIYLFHVDINYVEISFVISLSLPFILFFWLARQCAYLETKPRIAFWGSLVYAIIYFGGFIVTVLFKWVSVTNVFVFMALASIIGGLIIFGLIGIKKSNDDSTALLTIPPIFHENWNFGRWILFASIANGLSTLIYSPIIGIFLSVEMAGVFRGMQNFFLPFTQVITALSMLITPYLSRVRFTSSHEEFSRKITLLLLSSLALSVIYSGLILAVGNILVKLVYNNPIYTQNVWIIPFLGLSTIIVTINSALGVWFRVLEKPNWVFYEKVVGASAVFLISIPFVALLKMKGALIGLNISQFIELLALIGLGYFYFRKGSLYGKPDK